MVVPVLAKSDIKILSETGFGSYAAVKKATYKGKEVAVKSLYAYDADDYPYVVEFMREALMSHRLKHKNIVQFKGVLIDQPHLCLVYEYMTYGSLFDYLTKDRVRFRKQPIEYLQSIDLCTRLQFALDAAKGILFLHEHHIIHRDINTRNFLVTDIEQKLPHKLSLNAKSNAQSESEMKAHSHSYSESLPNIFTKKLIVKLCDFGTCRQISTKNRKHKNSMIFDKNWFELHSSTNSNENESNVHRSILMTNGIGTVAYMAPEILEFIDFSNKMKRVFIRERIEYEFAIDVFSFGGTLYEIMVSNELYYDLKSAKAVQKYVLCKMREKISDLVIASLGVPMAYIALMNQCWAHLPCDRPTFEEIVLQLQHIVRKIEKEESSIIYTS